ncbi:MAG TPA: hypothetical protein V6C78_29875 [Crinalium sp.]
MSDRHIELAHQLFSAADPIDLGLCGKLRLISRMRDVMQKRFV